MNLLTAPQVWDNYDPNELDLEANFHQTEENCKTYSYLAKKSTDGDVYAQIKVHYPSFDSNKVVLLVKNYGKYIQQEVVIDLVNKGYIVCIPDYDGCTDNTFTSFPQSLEYGYFNKTGEHINKVCPTALETCQYLYAVILRRAITFINDFLSKKEIVCIGFDKGVEVAMQVTAEDKRILGLACINGASYNEYIGHNKYGNDNELQIDDELMSWLTGVSSIAYAKHINVPVLFAVGSNGMQSDIDRISNIFKLIPNDNIRLVISPRYLDNIDSKSYNTVLSWLEITFVYSKLPKLPVISTNINKEGAVYANINIDSCIKVDEINVYYSYGDYNHATRYWEDEKGEAISIDEYIAKLEIGEAQAPLFSFAEVKYKNGITLSSIPFYQALSGHNVKISRYRLNPIVFQYSMDEGEFTEVNENSIVLENSLIEGVIPMGLKGLKCQNGAMVSFAIGTKNNIPNDKLLQIDTYSELKNYDLNISIITGGEISKEFTAIKSVETVNTFVSERFVANDFKDKDFMPLEDWSKVKGIKINNSNVIVGKIIYV
jgi:hypothetical protein